MSYDQATGDYARGNGCATVRDLALGDEELLARCDQLRMARGGPGGQHANKTASCVRLLHRATGLHAESSEHRDGASNRSSALRRLRLQLACALRGGADPVWLAAQVRGGRLQCGPTAASWPGAVAVLLDLLLAHLGDLKAAAAAAGLSTTQLARALVADQTVRRAADAIRAAHGLVPLRA